MNAQHRRPPSEWLSLPTSGLGRGIAQREARSLALAQAVVDKINGDPALLAAGARNLVRWRARRAGTLNRCDEEWDQLLKRSSWTTIRKILLDPCEEGKRLRASHPFVGILTEAERRAIYDAHRT
jgi:hypothetical protein